LNTIITILARGGSKGVPSKNIKPLFGKPLIHYTIEQAIQSGITPHVVVSSDSDEILKVSSQIKGVTAVRRPGEFATDTITKLPGIRHAVNEIEKKLSLQFDTIIDLDPTSPLREVEDILQSLKTFQNTGRDSLVTVCEARRSPYFNLLELNAEGKAVLSKPLPHPITCRQDSPACYDMNGSVYVWKRVALFEGERVIGPNTGLYIMPAERSIDIDHPIDFQMVEFFMNQKHAAKE
jgi:CMP-N,N'-diacetyllegionaminic acid synthase